MSHSKFPDLVHINHDFVQFPIVSKNGMCDVTDRDHPFASRLETSLYRFNTASDGQMVTFLKTDRDSESIVWYCTYIDW